MGPRDCLGLGRALLAWTESVPRGLGSQQAGAGALQMAGAKRDARAELGFRYDLTLVCVPAAGELWNSLRICPWNMS